MTKLIAFYFSWAIGIFLNCFLLCRNGVAVVCSIVVEDEIISDEVNWFFVSDGLLEFCRLFSVM